jgi:hypothetical protein
MGSSTFSGCMAVTKVAGGACPSMPVAAAKTNIYMKTKRLQDKGWSLTCGL